MSSRSSTTVGSMGGFFSFSFLISSGVMILEGPEKILTPSMLFTGFCGALFGCGVLQPLNKPTPQNASAKPLFTSVPHRHPRHRNVVRRLGTLVAAFFLGLRTINVLVDRRH